MLITCERGNSEADPGFFKYIEGRKRLCARIAHHHKREARSHLWLGSRARLRALQVLGF